jgi:hypothetical protein
MLNEYGPCEIHRQTFLKSWYAKKWIHLDNLVKTALQNI